MVNKKIKNYGYTSYRWLSNLLDPSHLIHSISGYIKYIKDMRHYSKMDGAEEIKFTDTYPCLHDNISSTPFEAHYFYQDLWTFKKIYDTKVKHHIDVGSNIGLISFLTTITKVTFIDIRPLIAQLKNFESKEGSILSMPYEDDSVKSISSLHVAEHIGLGRYGDPLDPDGTKKAALELQRVLAPGGNLFFSLPIGKPRLMFNAHRIHSTTQILDYFSDLKLVELSGIDDEGNFIENIKPEYLDSCDYGCGLFWFKK